MNVLVRLWMDSGREILISLGYYESDEIEEVKEQISAAFASENKTRYGNVWIRMARCEGYEVVLGGKT